MKRGMFLLVALLVVMTFLPASASATLNGPHWDLHLIGSKNGTSGDTSNGHAIMIPLKNAQRSQLTCNGQNVTVIDDTVPTYTNVMPEGAKLYWELGDDFQIVDRDATDGSAKIVVPRLAAGSDVIGVDVYVRVLGKPYTCMNVDAYAFDATQGLYFWAGSVDFNRQPGKTVLTKVNELFDVNWCNTADCTGTTQELSVFNSVFTSYFWNMLNDGTRNVEIRLYPKTK